MVYDAIVIGAGPSGLACALRLSFAGYKVALLERHTVIGGLNSFYKRRVTLPGQTQHSVMEFDSGLHALTNISSYVPNKPSSLERLLKALRLKKADLELCDHGRSCLWVKEKKIFFSSGIDSLKDALISEFPKQHTLLEDFFAHLVIYNEFAPEVGSPSVESARAILKEKLKDTTLVELLLFPVLTYGSATPQDMPYQLFACLFKSMFFEGMGRPKRGIRALYTPILDKLKANGVELITGAQVTSISPEGEGFLLSSKEGRSWKTLKIFSSAGFLATSSFSSGHAPHDPLCDFSFLEVSFYVNLDENILNAFPSLTFWSATVPAPYENPKAPWSNDMAVICIPGNFQGSLPSSKGLVRATLIADPLCWMNLDQEVYSLQKNQAIEAAKKIVMQLFTEIRHEDDLMVLDAFTPKTIKRYTGHDRGLIYGSGHVQPSGVLSPGIYLIGADQGYPGVVGAMLSGIQMANEQLIIGK